MAYQPDASTALINTFNGAVTRLDPYAVSPGDGLFAQNVQFARGSVSTRYGHSTTVNQGDVIKALQNWTFVFGATQVSLLTYYVPATGIKIYNSVGTAFTTIMTQAGAAGASMVTDGFRLYAAFYDASGRVGVVGGQVYGWSVGADPLFAAPSANAPTIIEPGSGVVTAGVHNFAYLMTTRNGFTTALCPSNGGPFGAANGFSPVPFTATGGHNLHVAWPGSYPSYMSNGTFQAVMTTVSNPSRYYAVPGASIQFPATGVTFSITDDDLAATGTDVTDYMNLLVNSSSGTVPFVPSAIFPYSSRLAYISIDITGQPVIYFSDPNNYQHITADQHAIYLEGRSQPVQGLSLRGVAYIGTTHAFYSIEDNGDVPVTWTPPQKVDGSIGILGPNCVSANTASGYAFIASERGLYLFQGGVFPPLPISYYRGNTDWERINWNAAAAVKLVDDQLNKRVLVVAPLDSSSIPTHILSWDYTEGGTPDTVKYSIGQIASGNYNIGSVAIILNAATQLNEVWYAPGASGYFIRQNDGTEANPYRDVTTAGAAAAINSIYQTSLIPGIQDQAQTFHDYHGAHLRVLGSGLLSIAAIRLDGTRTVAPAASPITLSATPTNMPLVKWYDRTQQATLQVGTNAIDNWFSLAQIEAYYTNSISQK